MIALINKRSRRELIQLLECLLYTPCTPRGNGAVKSFASSSSTENATSNAELVTALQRSS